MDVGLALEVPCDSRCRVPEPRTLQASSSSTSNQPFRRGRRRLQMHSSRSIDEDVAVGSNISVDEQPSWIWVPLEVPWITYPIEEAYWAPFVVDEQPTQPTWIAPEPQGIFLSIPEEFAGSFPLDEQPAFSFILPELLLTSFAGDEEFAGSLPLEEPPGWQWTPLEVPWITVTVDEEFAGALPLEEPPGWIWTPTESAWVAVPLVDEEFIQSLPVDESAAWQWTPVEVPWITSTVDEEFAVATTAVDEYGSVLWITEPLWLSIPTSSEDIVVTSATLIEEHSLPAWVFPKLVISLIGPQEEEFPPKKPVPPPPPPPPKPVPAQAGGAATGFNFGNWWRWKEDQAWKHPFSPPDYDKLESLRRQVNEETGDSGYVEEPAFEPPYYVVEKPVYVEVEKKGRETFTVIEVPAEPAPEPVIEYAPFPLPPIALTEEQRLAILEASDSFLGMLNEPLPPVTMSSKIPLWVWLTGGALIMAAGIAIGVALTQPKPDVRVRVLPKANPVKKKRRSPAGRKPVKRWRR